MINLEKCKKIFLEYTDTFDKNNIIVSAKIGHTIEVMNLSNIIAKSLGLTEEEIELASLIGLLHDIGRFEQAINTNSCKDSKSFDHASIGIRILFEENKIEEFLPDTRKYDNIIKNAINEHSRFKISDKLNEEELKFAKIIRDADKLDIYRRIIEGNLYTMAISSGYSKEIKFSENVLKAFYNNKQLPRSELYTILDYFLNSVAFTYDINFHKSFEILKEKEYLRKLIERGEELNKEEAQEFKKIGSHMEEYLINKLK